MERISGSIKRVKRLWRKRPKGRIRAAVMAAVLTLSTVAGALAPVAQAYAAENTAYIARGRWIEYGGGNGRNTAQRTATLNGQSHEAYCMNPSRPGDYTGYVPAQFGTVSDLVRTYLWFGYGGPGFDASMWPSTYYDGSAWTADKYLVVTHTLLADAYEQDFNNAVWGKSYQFKLFIASQILGYGNSGMGESYNPNSLCNKMQARASEVPGTDVFQVYTMDLNQTSYDPSTADDGTHQGLAQILVSYLYYPKGYVQVHKVSANTSITDGNDMYSLEGAEFTVYNSGGTSMGTLTTDENGNTGTLTLDPGTYTVKETKTPEGYYAAADQQVTVTGNVTSTVTVADVPANDPVMMLVGKFDGERTYSGEANLPQGSARLDGAEFTIEYYDTLDYDSYEELTEAGVEPTRTWVVSTDSDGFADLSASSLVSGDAFYMDTTGTPTLPRGTVVVYESKAPEGYLLNNQDVSFQKIQENTPEGVITYNTPQTPEPVMRGGVSVQKLDAQTGSTPQGDADFSGITFSIINNNENSVIVNDTEYAPGATVMTIVTNENGVASTASDALPYGSYIIRETGTNDSYLNTSDDINATVSEDGTTYYFSASDDVVRGGVEVYKRDLESDLATPLGGASLDGTQFEVKSLSDDPVIVNGVTYGKGDVVATLTIKDGYAATAADALPYGTYSLQEVKAGEGYNLTDGTAYEFSIREQGVVVNPVTGDGHVHDQVRRSDLEFNKKADDSGDRLAGIPFKVTSVTTGESHVVVTDENGYFSSASSWNAHTTNTNGNDWALEAGADDVIDSTELDPTAGVWFGLTTEGSITAADDSLGALPYDRYTIEELRCTANEGYQLVSTSIVVSRHGVTYNFGTIDDVPQGTAAIFTNAYDPTDNDYSIQVGDVAIADKVTYSGLVTGGQYRLVTTVVDAATGEAITVDGQPVTATHDFTATGTTGYEVVEMSLPTFELGDKTITVYEELYRLSDGSTTLIAEHKDKDDVDQQLKVVAPEIGTSAADGVDGDKNVVTDDVVNVVDTVSYTGLIPGKEYTVSGTLMVKGTDDEGNVTEEPFEVDGQPVTAEATFTPEASEGTVDVTFTFNGLGIEEGTQLVAFESLELDGHELAVHADINDQNQTVTITYPEIGTSAADTVDGDRYIVTDPETTVVDTVSYTGLVPGKEYTVSGTLMVKGTDDEGNVTEEPFVVGDEPVTAETTFTPEAADGTVDVTFTFDSSALEAGTELVVFENLYREGTELATHADINDTGQTVTTVRPEIGTTATDGFDGDKNVVSDSQTTVVDTVAYTGLVPGKEYTVSGTLMVKGTDDEGNVTEEALEVDGQPVTAEATFTPEASEGTVDVTFTFDSSAIPDGTQLVAFETLYRGDVEIAVHADIEDEAQTVTVRETAIGTIARDGLDGDQKVIADAETTITDTVAYADVLTGTDYTMAGILMDKETGLPILTGNGSEKYTEDEVRAFMDELASVTGIDSEDEVTVDTAALSALLADNADLVSHMVIASTALTPESASGTVSMDFSFDSNAVIDRLSGEAKDIVVFEVLFKGSFEEGTEVPPVVAASELDLENEGQTVTLFASSIGTTATDKSDGDHEMLPNKDAVITDTVTYDGLIPGKEYTLKATLYDKETGEPLSIGDKHVTAELKFTPNSQSGTVDIDLGPFDASELDGHDLVVFEELYKQTTDAEGNVEDVLVAEHKDINDENQTVSVTSTPKGTTYGKTGGDNTSLLVAVVLLLAAAGGFTAYGIRKRHAAASVADVEDTIAKPHDGSDE